MAASLRPLLLALVLLGTNWANTETFSLPDFMFFDTTTSSPATDEHPPGTAHHHHHHGHHTTNEHNGTQHSHAHHQSQVHPGEDVHNPTHHDHPNTGDHLHDHDHTQTRDHPHNHDRPHTRDHPHDHVGPIIPYKAFQPTASIPLYHPQSMSASGHPRGQSSLRWFSHPGMHHGQQIPQPIRRPFFGRHTSPSADRPPNNHDPTHNHEHVDLHPNPHNHSHSHPDTLDATHSHNEDERSHTHNHPHPNTNDNHRQHHNRRFTFQDPLNLFKRRQSNQWTGTNKKLPKTTQDAHTTHHHDHRSPRHGHSSPPHHSSKAYISPPYPPSLFPYHQHPSHDQGDVQSYHHGKTPFSPHPHYSPHDSHSYHTHPHDQTHSYDHAHPHHHAYPHDHHHGQGHHHREPSPYFPSLIGPPPPPPPPLPKLLVLPLPPPPPKCPMLYSRIGDRCIAIFSITRMTWNDAMLFCDGIFGEPFAYNHMMQFYDMVNFLKKAGLSTPLWVGGRAGPSGWYWTGQKTLMPLGTPFWAVREKSSSSSGTIQTPATNLTDYSQWCAAMNPEDYYYLSDAKCNEKKAPVCVLRQDAEVVAARGNTHYYPALANTFKAWNEMGGCMGGDDSSDESSDESSSSSSSSSEGQESSTEDEGEEEEEEEEEVKVEEENVEVEDSTITPEITVTMPKEEEVDSHTEKGSGIGEAGDDEDMEDGSGILFLWDSSSSIGMQDYDAVHDIFIDQ